MTKRVLLIVTGKLEERALHTSLTALFAGTDVRQRLRDQCSFHLLAPMVEAYFYGEADALIRAGQVKPSRFDAGMADIESFVVDDPDYMASQDPRWAAASRELHPKRYLKYLCDPGEYRETHEGTRALASLAWTVVLRAPPHGQLARALIDDISDALGVANPCPGDLSTHTGRRPGAVLRNL